VDVFTPEELHSLKSFWFFYYMWLPQLDAVMGNLMQALIAAGVLVFLAVSLHVGMKTAKIALRVHIALETTASTSAVPERMRNPAGARVCHAPRQLIRKRDGALAFHAILRLVLLASMSAIAVAPQMDLAPCATLQRARLARFSLGAGTFPMARVLHALRAPLHPLESALHVQGGRIRPESA
jgi:hypothetical protein